MNYGSPVVNESYSENVGMNIKEGRSDFERIESDIAQNLKRGDEALQRLSIVAEKFKSISPEPVADPMLTPPHQPGLIGLLQGRVQSWRDQLILMEKFITHLERIV